MLRLAAPRLSRGHDRCPVPRPIVDAQLRRSSSSLLCSKLYMLPLHMLKGPHPGRCCDPDPLSFHHVDMRNLTCARAQAGHLLDHIRPHAR